MILVPILYRRTARQLKEDGDDGSGRLLNRESRLFFARIGAPAIPIGLFWMGWTNYVSTPTQNLHQCSALTQIVLDLRLVAPRSLRGHRVRHHLCLPVRVHVHYRLVPAVRRVCAYLRCARQIPRCRGYDGRGYPYVPEPGHALDVDGAGDYQCRGDADSLYFDALGAVVAEEEQVGDGVVDLACCSVYIGSTIVTVDGLAGLEVHGEASAFID